MFNLGQFEIRKKSCFKNITILCLRNITCNTPAETFFNKTYSLENICFFLEDVAEGSICN